MYGWQELRNDFEAIQIMAKAFKECDLDCSAWPEEARLELAFIALQALRSNKNPLEVR